MTTDLEQQGASLDEELAGAIPEDGGAPPAEVQDEPPAIEYHDPHPMMKERYREAFSAWRATNEDGTPRYPEGHVWQEAALEDFKERLGEITKRQQEAAEYRRQMEQLHGYANQWNQVLTPYQRLAARLGTDEHTLVRRALGLLQGFRDDPQGTLLEVAREAGIDINQIGQQQPYVSDTEAKLERELRDLKRSLAQRDASMSQERIQQLQAQQQAYANQVTQHVESFRAEKGEDGNLKRPHMHPDSPFWQQVDQKMAMLVHGQRQIEGSQFRPDLDALYQTACSLIPEIAQADAAAKAKREAEAKAAKAKKEQAASARVAGTHSGAKPPKQTLDEELWGHINAA